MMAGSGQLTVPPGFRFHPTDEELLYYYLRKKVSFEAIDLDVIREIDLNKLEPWDLKEKCRIGSGPQNEWYFFSHKDKKYPTGTRTNRATTAGFWKATGRDKAIYHTNNSKRIGMRKTLVFYTGRAPHGQKTDWIMHEYRLDEDDTEIQEDGWVVCRVFKKKNQNRGYQQEIEEEEQLSLMRSNNILEPKHHHHFQQGDGVFYDYNNNFDGTMQLPQLFSPESAITAAAASSMNAMDILECSQNLLRLTTNNNGSSGLNLMQLPQGGGESRFNGDWSFLDKLLASHSHHHVPTTTTSSSSAAAHQNNNNNNKLFPFHYLGCEPHDHDIMKFSK